MGLRGDCVGRGRLHLPSSRCRQNDIQTPFYPPGYHSDVGTLPFCGALPDNPLGLRFTLAPIWKMSEDTLLKAHELPRALPRGIGWGEEAKTAR